MALTWPVVAAVLFGALLHASWNALIKSSGDKALDTALVHLMGALVATPLMLWVGLPEPQSWPFIAASLVIHIGYYIALVGAYQNGDLGLTYPIMRGFAPLLVALGSGMFIGELPSPASWAGVVAITLGVALVGLARHEPVLAMVHDAASVPSTTPEPARRSVGDAASPALQHAAPAPHAAHALRHRKALAFAFANAAIIALYTLVDGRGVRVSGNALRYVMLLFVLDGVAYPLLVWWRRDAQGRRDILTYARQRWPVATLGGSASIGSYAIALWAMTRAPVASVAALRETSVLFAALLGTVLLKERFGLQRAAGTGVIVAGVMALRFG